MGLTSWSKSSLLTGHSARVPSRVASPQGARLIRQARGTVQMQEVSNYVRGACAASCTALVLTELHKGENRQIATLIFVAAFGPQKTCKAMFCCEWCHGWRSRILEMQRFMEVHTSVLFGWDHEIKSA
mmetsp:Transcript_44006/g.68814  ORF Transcript_44006/g.68814 Transcript_44006/m.68814 type:complete len:128 (+) Transcript_44006:374-757(+)